jgi:hypothetical protein
MTTALVTQLDGLVKLIAESEKQLNQLPEGDEKVSVTELRQRCVANLQALRDAEQMNRNSFGEFDKALQVAEGKDFTGLVEWMKEKGHTETFAFPQGSYSYSTSSWKSAHFVGNLGVFEVRPQP